MSYYFTDIYSHLLIALDSEAIVLPFLPMISIPKLMLYLIGNTLTQYICISAVFILTTECASLTVTLVVTLRKVRLISTIGLDFHSKLSLQFKLLIFIPIIFCFSLDRYCSLYGISTIPLPCIIGLEQYLYFLGH